jgi:hypothetical protein
MSSTSGAVADPPRQLVVEWAMCGIANATTRFIPVPIVDDLIEARSTQFCVHRTLKAHDRTYDDDAVEPLYAPEAHLAGVLRAMVSVPLRIVLFPIRKYVRLFGAVHGVPNDVMHVILLGRAVHRVLARGGLENGSDEKALRAEAEQVRRAYDGAIKNQDFRLLRGALTDGLSQGRGLTRAAVTYARDAFAREKQPKLKPGGEVESSARKVESALERPDVVQELEEFDRRFDERLAKELARR